MTRELIHILIEVKVISQVKYKMKDMTIMDVFVGKEDCNFEKMYSTSLVYTLCNILGLRTYMCN